MTPTERRVLDAGRHLVWLCEEHAGLSEPEDLDATGELTEALDAWEAVGAGDPRDRADAVLGAALASSSSARERRAWEAALVAWHRDWVASAPQVMP